MNIVLQSCGLIIMFIIIYFSSKQRKLKLKTNIVYLATVLNTTLLIIVDIIQVFTITYSDSLPQYMAIWVCKAYLIILNTEALCGLLYTITDTLCNDKDIVRTKYCVIAISLTISVLTLLMPIHYYYNVANKTVFKYGLSCDIAHVGSMAQIILTILLCLSYKYKMTAKRFNAIMIWMIVWLIALYVQYKYGEVLVVGFACSIGTLVIYLQLENPEKYLDLSSGFFNQQAFQEYTKQMYNDKKQFSIIIISGLYDVIKNSEKYSSSNMLRVYLNYFSYFTKLVFIYEYDKILLIFNNKKSYRRAIEQITKDFEYSDDSMFKPFIYSIQDCRKICSTYNLMSLINYVSLNNDTLQENNYIDINDDKINKFENNKKVIDMVRDAITEDRIEVFYQPIYSVFKKKFTSAEALIRIRDRDNNLIYPSAFIDVIEKTELIINVGKIVFDKVCKFISETDMDKLGLEYIEINLSMVQCNYKSLAPNYIDILNKYNIDSKYINLEITESASLEAKNILLRNMRTLIRSGVTFSLDDFGTGNSNLNYIMEMPVKIVKFDKGMINAYFNNNKSQYIMEAAMHMIKGLRLKIVAEGIETAEQFNRMEELNIDYIQGYYFSKPIQKDEFVEFVRNNNIGN